MTSNSYQPRIEGEPVSLLAEPLSQIDLREKPEYTVARPKGVRVVTVFQRRRPPRSAVKLGAAVSGAGQPSERDIHAVPTAVEDFTE